MNQTGKNEAARRGFLKQVQKESTARLLIPWQSPYEHAPVF